MIDLTGKRNIYFVGDLHGDWKALQFFLKQVDFNYRDALVSVGDLIDRGTQNLEVINFFQWTENAWAVRGNHEDMLIQGVLGNERNQFASWIANGGEWALDLPNEMINGMAKTLATLPLALTFRHENTKFGVCHAEVPTNDWEIFTGQLDKHFGWQQKALWGREHIKAGGSRQIRGVDYAIHGHSVRNNVTVKGNQIWIDTGSVFDNGGNGYALTIIEWIPEREKFIQHRICRDHFEPGGLRHAIIDNITGTASD